MITNASLPMSMIELPIIGYLRSPLSQKFGIPRQPNLVQIPSIIEFIPPYDTPSAFEGIENFSHLWLIWQFHHNREQDNFKPQVRPPRLGGNAKIGLFATRSMYRPANIGLSVVQLKNVEIRDGKTRLHVNGADMVDGTPILDIKPYIAYSDSITGAKSGFADSEPVQKTVTFSPEFEQQFMQILKENGNNSLSNENFHQPNLVLQDLTLIENLIAQDPRPAYRQDEIGAVFTMRYKGFDVGFFMDKNGVLLVDKLVKIESE